MATQGFSFLFDSRLLFLIKTAIKYQMFFSLAIKLVRKRQENKNILMTMLTLPFG
jgi:uncharacterized membrane protein YgdD (TMEM256/DUF423 family)